VRSSLPSDPSWGSAEGPALDSKNNLYFTSRGTWKGIVRWNKAEGSQRYAEVAKKAGPGGLWIDDADNIFLTATDEREVWKLSPAKKVTVVAKKGFEADPKLAKGPNDVVVAKSGIVYFTDPNGYYGDAPNGTVYWIDRAGKTKVFSAAITGPNGIILGLDEKTLYVSHNVAKTTSKITCWTLNEDGSAGEMREFATVPDCVADGVAMRSPYRGDCSRRSTAFSYALGEWSFRNASTSAGVGGSPVRSSVRRRISVVRSASGEG
jgi:gluconolactonase